MSPISSLPKAKRAQLAKPSRLVALIGIACWLHTTLAIQFKVKIEHDMSKPSYGLLMPTSSQLTYDPQNGLKLKGALKEVLGPPVKVVRGVKNILRGSRLGGLGAVGATMRTHGAVLGVDTHKLEATGASKLIERGLLRSVSGVGAGADLAGIVEDLPGRRLSSMIEVPVKVVSVRDLSSSRRSSARSEGRHAEDPALTGEELRRTGFNQVFEGASESVQNLGNMVSRASNDAATAFRLLPVVLDIQREEYEQEQKEKQKKAQEKSSADPGQTGAASNSLLASLTSILTGDNANHAQLVSNQENQYAAMLGAGNPLANLLMSSNLDPILTPISASPLTQSLQMKQLLPEPQVPNSSPIGQSITNRYRPFPGVSLSETISDSPVTRSRSVD